MTKLVKCIKILAAAPQSLMVFLLRSFDFQVPSAKHQGNTTAAFQQPATAFANAYSTCMLLQLTGFIALLLLFNSLNLFLPLTFFFSINQCVVGEQFT